MKAFPFGGRWQGVLLVSAIAVGAPAAEQAYLGVSVEPVSPALGRQLDLSEGVGVTVRQVDPEGPAADVVDVHDVLVRFDDQWLTGHRHLATLVRRLEPGRTVHIERIRRGRTETVDVRLGARPAGPLPAPDAPPWEAPRLIRPRLPSFRITPPDGFWEQFDHLLDEFGLEDWRERMREGWRPGRRLEPDESVLGRRGGSRSLTEVRDGISTTLREENGDRHVRAVDAEGRVLFEGPVNTDEEKAEVPEELRERLDPLLRHP